jgi:hypothetical protein
MPELVDVTRAAQELHVDPSRIRALIADGSLQADKVGGRWLVHWDSVVSRRRQPGVAGRPLAPRNAWTLLLEACGEEPLHDVDAHARWRIRRALRHESLAALRSRLSRRADDHHLWGLPGELRALRDDDAVVFTGSSAAGALRLDLAAPDTIDAYVRDEDLGRLVHQYGLEASPTSRANVVLRSVPDDAWVLADRRIAPRAAVALDLASYPDPRSQRIGEELLTRLDAERGWA